MDVGYGLVPGLFSLEEVAAIKGRLPDLEGQAGSRGLLEFEWCAALAVEPRLKGLADSLVHGEARPVRGILFDKVAGRNWNLGWHQDTKIAVRAAKPEVPGFSAWSVKEGVVHTLPPVEVLELCVALRIHLDPCPADNGPLQVIPGSHHMGLRDYPSDDEIATAVTLTAEVGDLIWMRPLVFHGSPRATRVDHRRVLHIEYSSAVLPGGLEWAWSVV
ncbi:Phytanoyl-CoA dioxygenase [Fimbriimonadaceae bacterium]